MENKNEEKIKEIVSKYGLVSVKEIDTNGESIPEKAFQEYGNYIRQQTLEEAKREVLEEVKEIISKHNARILNEFQQQGTPDMPFIAYDERVCLIPAMTKATEETLSTIHTIMKLKEIHKFLTDLVKILQEKVNYQEKMKKLPETSKEYTKGQLYEAQYILDILEKIIYEDMQSHG